MEENTDLKSRFAFGTLVDRAMILHVGKRKSVARLDGHRDTTVREKKLTFSLRCFFVAEVHTNGTEGGTASESYSELRSTVCGRTSPAAH